MRRVLSAVTILALLLPAAAFAQGRMEDGYTGCEAPTPIASLPTCSNATWDKVCVVHDLDTADVIAQAGKCKTAGGNAGGGTYHGWCSCDKATGEWKIVGGVSSGGGGPESDPVYLSEKGQPSGVATLDGTGKVPVAQTPCSSGDVASGQGCIDVETAAEATAHEGDPAAHHSRYTDGEAVSAVATANPNLDTDDTDDCTVAQSGNCPAQSESDPVALAQKGQLNGIAPLDGSGRVPTGNLPNNTSYLGSAIQIEEVDGTDLQGDGTKLTTSDALTPLRCLETDVNGKLVSSDADCGTVGAESDPVFLAQKGAASGVATLDGSSLVPDAQIPANVSRLGTTISTAEIDAASKNGTTAKVALTAGLSGLKCVETDASGNLVSSADVCGTSGGTGGHTIRNDSGNLPTQTGLHFSGSGVTVSDDDPNDETDVVITAGPNVSFNADGGPAESTAITALECDGNGLACSEPVDDTARIGLSIGSSATQVAAGDHAHTGSTISGLDLSADTSIQVTAPITLDTNTDTLAVSDATTTAKGVAELATDGENAANVVVQGNDARLSNTRTPTDSSVTASKMADADHGDVSWSGGVASVDANAVALGTDTTGNYVGGVTCGTGVTGCPADGEGNTGTVSVVDDTTTQRVEMRKNSTGGAVAARKRINVIEGSNVTVDVADDVANNELDVTISASVATSGDAVSVDGAGVLDPNFDDGGDINFSASGSPATVTGAIKNDTVGLLELAGNNGASQSFGDFTCTDASCLVNSNAITSDKIANGEVANEDLANGSATFAKQQDIGPDTLVGRDDVASGDPEEIALGQGLALSSNTLSTTNADDDGATKGVAAFDNTHFDATDGVVTIASVAGVTGADADNVSLADVQAATTNDFHNIGGTDAKCSLSGSCDKLIVDTTTCQDVSGDRYYHDTNCDGDKDAGERWVDETCMEDGTCNPRGEAGLFSSVTAAECDGTLGKCDYEASCNSAALAGDDQGVCMGGTSEGQRCDINADCTGGSICTPGDIHRLGVSCDGRWETRLPNGAIRSFAYTDELGAVSYCPTGQSIIGNSCQDDFTQAEADALFNDPTDLASGSTIGGYSLCFDVGDGCGSGSSSAPADAKYLVGEADAVLSAEIVVGLTPGGVLGNTWADPSLDDDAVTFAKMQNIATDVLLGRDTAGTGDPESIALHSTLAMTGTGAVGVAASGITSTELGTDAVTQAKVADDAIGPNELATGAVDVSTTDVTGVLAAGRFPALTGPVTTSPGSLATTIAADAIGAAQLATGAVDLSTTDVTGTLAAGRFPALTNDVTTSAGSLSTTIAANAVNSSKIADGTIVDGDIATAAEIAVTKLLEGTSAQMLMTNGSSTPAWTSMGGDATLGASGDFQLNSGVVGSSEILDGQVANIDVSTTANIAVSKLAAGNSAEILMNNGTPSPTWTTVSGDATISATGAVSLAAGSIDEAHLNATNGPTSGYALTYGGTDNFTWAPFTGGVRLAEGDLDLGQYNGVALSEDFSTTLDTACVGGTAPGKDCATNDDCDESGVCTDDQQRVIALNADVYRVGSAIQATDMPATGAVDFGGLTSLKLPTSAASGAATEGFVWFDSNGGTPAIPMPTIGDGTNALPMRACSRVNTGWTTTANSDVDYWFGSGGATFVASTTTIVTEMYPKKTTLSGLQCMWWDDGASGETAAFTFEHALLSTCAAESDGGQNTCDLGTPSALTCTITGGASQTVGELSCSDTTNAVTVPAASVGRFKVDKTGTWNFWFMCGWMECIDAF